MCLQEKCLCNIWPINAHIPTWSTDSERRASEGAQLGKTHRQAEIDIAACELLMHCWYPVCCHETNECWIKHRVHSVLACLCVRVSPHEQSWTQPLTLWAASWRHCCRYFFYLFIFFFRSDLCKRIVNQKKKKSTIHLGALTSNLWIEFLKILS